jgi:putative ABC transport system permease protein
MLDRDTWQEIYETVRANKLRTALTAFGVIWGIYLLIIMLGAGNGLENGVTRSLSSRATNAVYVWGQRTNLPYQGMRPGRRVTLKNADVDAVRERVDGLEYVSPRVQLGGYRSSQLVRRGQEAGSFNVMGDHPEYRYIEPMIVEAGRFINWIDMRERRKVAVIGREVRDLLFDKSGGEPVIGSAIEIGGVYFQVVGVIRARQSGDAGERQAQTVYTPFTTFQQAFHQGDRVAWLTVTVNPGYNPVAVEHEIRRLIAARHKIAPEDENALGSFNAKREFDKIRTTFMGIKVFFWFVGIATLLTGVFGVSNIMVISVKERTKEIGVRKALGATPLSIVGTIIQESVVLTAVSGYLGVVAGVAQLEAVTWLMRTAGVSSTAFDEPQVQLSTVLVATVILVVAGVIAGIIPAWQAAGVKPVEALRAE